MLIDVLVVSVVSVMSVVSVVSVVFVVVFVVVLVVVFTVICFGIPELCFKYVLSGARRTIHYNNNLLISCTHQVLTRSFVFLVSNILPSFL